jgi:hypothetical protein
MADLNTAAQRDGRRRVVGAEGGQRPTFRGPEGGQREYVSCVRIKGRPILPPVMTEELRWIILAKGNVILYVRK